MSYRILTTEEIRHRKGVLKGIQLCMLVLGERGSGKTTFLNTICNQTVFSNEELDTYPAHEYLSPESKVITRSVQLYEENCTPIFLDVVLIPGVGDYINNSDSSAKVVEYLEDRFEEVFSEEIKIKRSMCRADGRPHVCLYFIRATSKGLREFDIQLMSKICSKVNIIPVISKADLLTPKELILNKRLILNDIKRYNINIYNFGDEKIEDVLGICNNESESSSKIVDLLPFALTSSTITKTYPNGDIYHVREYPWGDVKVEDLTHSDFIYLKNILFGSHLEDFKNATHNILYENYRTEKLLADSKDNDCILAEGTGIDISQLEYNEKDLFTNNSMNKFICENISSNRSLNSNQLQTDSVLRSIPEQSLIENITIIS